MAESWCILRTSSRHTLRLVESLQGAGIDAWTPSIVRTIRKPRWNVKREVRLPMMASFVFAPAKHMWTLVDLEEDRRSPHPSFSLFRHQDSLPLVPDGELEPLRMAERRAIPAQKARAFSRGQNVRVPEGSFAGMIGKVEHSNGRHTLVCFGGPLKVKIATYLLKLECVSRKAA